MRSVECVDRFPHIPHSSFFICLNSVNLLKFKIEISQLKQLNCRTL